MATTLNSIDTRIPRARVSCTRSTSLIGRYFFPDKGAHAFHRALSIVSTRVSAYTRGCGWSRDFRVDEFLRVVFYCFFCRAMRNTP